MKKKLVPSVLLLMAAVTGGLAPFPGGVTAQTGSIRGTVTTPPPRPARRTPRGYGRDAKTPQEIPIVAYLAGAIEGSGTAARAPLRMVQADTAFAPPAIFVPTGGTVDFPNTDPFFHNVFSYSRAKRFDLGRYPRGESKAVTFEEPGLVEVFCEVHEFMRAVVVVTRNPFHTEVDADGVFTLSGVPPGEHTLVVWHPQFGASEMAVVVTSGSTTPLEIELGAQLAPRPAAGPAREPAG